VLTIVVALGIHSIFSNTIFFIWVLGLTMAIFAVTRVNYKNRV
jgi:hypothetical protein